MLRAIVLLGMVIGLSGCAEATIATASTIAGITAAGISTGADVYRMGKLDSVEIAGFDEFVQSTHKAAADLKLKIEKEEFYDDGKWRCTLADDQGQRFRVYLERRTMALCRSRIDMGVFGSEPTARLMLAHAPTSSDDATVAGERGLYSFSLPGYGQRDAA